MIIHVLNINKPSDDSVEVLTQVAVNFGNVTYDVWCTVVDPVDFWLIVVLVFVIVVVLMGIDDEELNAPNISVYNNKNMYIHIQ